MSCISRLWCLTSTFYCHHLHLSFVMPLTSIMFAFEVTSPNGFHWICMCLYTCMYIHVQGRCGLCYGHRQCIPLYTSIDVNTCNAIMSIIICTCSWHLLHVWFVSTVFLLALWVMPALKYFQKQLLICPVYRNLSKCHCNCCFSHFVNVNTKSVVHVSSYRRLWYSTVHAPASCDEEDALYSSICNLIVPSLTD